MIENWNVNYFCNSALAYAERRSEGMGHIDVWHNPPEKVKVCCALHRKALKTMMREKIDEQDATS